MIKDYEQRESLDYQETYNSVIEHSTLRNIFAIAIARNCKMITFDVKTAFLYGELEDEIFMYPPEGYNYKNKILKFKKAIYGLRQAPLKHHGIWNLLISWRKWDLSLWVANNVCLRKMIIIWFLESM